jgi:3-oxoacyl-[acyl-carrier-protein] synthase-3
MSSPKAYITSAGVFLPGKPVHNDDMEEYLGKINGKPSRTKEKMLKQNGIQFRHYALDKQQQSLFSASQMAAYAIQTCLEKSAVHPQEVDFMAAATTQGDLCVPGFASMVHGHTQLPICEIASLHGVCGSGMMAIKNAWLQIVSGEKQAAVACAGEFASRMFKAQRFEQQHEVREKGSIALETDFLRWMLSDGAGALLLQPQPSPQSISFEIQYIDIRSYAHLFDVCMYAGANKTKGELSTSWMEYDTFQQADLDGAINLKQDLKLVQNIVKLGVQRFFELIEAGKLDPKAIDYLLCHYSSHFFKGEIVKLLEKGGLVIPEEKWFTNLYTKGNTGAASIYVMLEELLREKELKAGQQILCMVPESGRFLTSFMLLTVIEPPKKAKTYFTPVNPPAIQITGNKTQEWLVRQLTQVWVDFETRLNRVPIVDKINRGVLTVAEYKALLLNLRQQVVDGSQWIARAASNVSMDFFDVRSSFIRHSSDEHRDYQILEKNFISLGGTMDEIRQGEKNIGSEALSAYMFQRASLPNPFDLLGGMFIIEGLGNRLAGKWGRAIQEQLDLADNQVSFLIYHESSDASDNHFERFEKAIQSELLTMDIARKVVKTAKVVARLYRLQLEEIGNY